MFFRTLESYASSEDGHYYYIMALVLCGMTTYLAAVLYFAPQQKYKAMKIACELMRSSPEEFVPTDAKASINPNSPAQNPKESSTVDRHLRRQTFQELTDMGNEEAMRAFEDGMNSYGLLHVWGCCVAKNSKNCCEKKHGLPFYRLARLGFHADIHPKDLGGILNANACYTLCCGVLQLVCGVLVMNKHGITLASLMPWSISAVSFILSFLNIFFDFSEILHIIDYEKRAADKIKQQGTIKIDKQTAELRSGQDKEIAAIKKKYEVECGSVLDQDSLLAMEKEIHAARSVFQHRVQGLERALGSDLLLAISLWRERTERTRQVMKGKHFLTPQRTENDPLAQMRDFAANIETQKAKVWSLANEAVQELDQTDQDYSEKLKAIITKRDETLEVLEQYSGPAANKSRATSPEERV